MNALSRLIRHDVGRYMVTGVSVYILELVSIVVAQWLGASVFVAVAISFWLGLIVSFVLQKFVTFGDKRTRRRIIMPQIIAVTLLVIFNFGFTMLATKLLVDVMPAVLIRTVALGMTTLWNFYLYKTRIFNQDEGMVY